MRDLDILLPSQPKAVKEEEFTGIYEIEGFYPGYGHTIGNSLRRIILSSLPGAAITSVKIDGVKHEFSTIDGIKEDVVGILINLGRVRLRMEGEEPQSIRLSIKGEKEVRTKDFEVPGQVEILNPDQLIATLTDKNAELLLEATVEKGLGFVSKEQIQKDRVDIGTIALDSLFTPVRRVHYEVENMRVGERTDFNRLRVIVETDGTISPREVLERSVEIMIKQLKAIVGFQEEEEIKEEEIKSIKEEMEDKSSTGEVSSEDEKTEFLKTRIEDLGLSTRTENALTEANIRTVGGLVRKKEDDILTFEGLGEKGLQEIKRALGNYGITLKQ
jgi:DNA-directed RNA polymerase subunit alpha